MNLEDYQLIGRGNTAEIYHIGNKKVLKLFHAGFNKEAVKIEYQNSKLVQENLDCVPRVYEMVEVEGRDGIIYEEICGKDMLQMMLRAPLRISKKSKEFARYHYSIHKKVKEPLITVKEKLNYDIAGSEILTEETKTILKQYINTLPDGDCLCHFDFHPGNVMIVDGKAVFLDWMTGCKGDICADVARTSLLLKYGQIEHAPILVQKLLSLGKRSIRKNYCKEYMALAGITAEDISKWEVPIAAARLQECIPDKERKILLDFINRSIDRCKAAI